MFEYLKVSKQTQYNIILRYTQLSKYAIAQSPDSTSIKRPDLVSI